MLLTSLTLPACRKVDFGPEEGYTPRDANNTPMGNADKTDWTSDQDWKKVERELFKDSGVDLQQSQQGVAINLTVFPNPVAQQGMFLVRPNTSRTVIPDLQGQVVLVDKKYKVLQQFAVRTNTGGVGTMLDFTDDKYEQGQLYRLYYIFYDDNKALYLKGHGDIKVSR